MEVTLEKIDLIRERTGVSVAQAKDALVASNGDVVEALIAIEREAAAGSGANGTGGWADRKATEVTDKLRELWSKGVDTKIRLVNKEDQTLFDVPLTAGVVGALLAPQAALAGALVAYASKCSFEFKTQARDVQDAADTDVQGSAMAGSDDAQGMNPPNNPLE